MPRAGTHARRAGRNPGWSGSSGSRHARVRNCGVHAMQPAARPGARIAAGVFAAVTATAQAATLSGVVDISVGHYHTCALVAGRPPHCWGSGRYGELGVGHELIVHPFARAVAGIGPAVQTVETGPYLSCATRDGQGWCWGQLIEGNSFSPTLLTGLPDAAVAFAIGAMHECVLTTSGTIACRGNNALGQLGDGTTTYRPGHVMVAGLDEPVQAITAGSDHTCALTTAGGVKCWGANGSGQLGDGTTTRRLTPVAVTGLGSGIQAISAGHFHTCALTAGGAVLCWGANAEGQLGDNSQTSRTTPVAVVGLGAGVQAISAGGEHSCALKVGGNVECWGANALGQLGDLTHLRRLVPVPVLGLGQATTVGAGTYHTCAATQGGMAYCWGDNIAGQLGDGTAVGKNLPSPVLLSDFIFTGSFQEQLVPLRGLRAATGSVPHPPGNR